MLWDCCSGASFAELLSRYYTDVGKVAVLFRVIEAVADHKFIGNLKSYVVALQRQLTARRFIEQGCDLQRAWLPGHQKLFQISHGQAGVENVFHEDDVLFLQRLIHILGQLYFTGRVPAGLEFLTRTGTIAVAGDSDEVKGRIEVDLPCEIRKKDRGPLQHANQIDGLSRVVFGNLRAQFRDAPGNVVPWNQHLQIGHGDSY